MSVCVRPIRKEYYLNSRSLRSLVFKIHILTKWAEIYEALILQVPASRGVLHLGPHASLSLSRDNFGLVKVVIYHNSTSPGPKQPLYRHATVERKYTKQLQTAGDRVGALPKLDLLVNGQRGHEMPFSGEWGYGLQCRTFLRSLAWVAN